MSVRSIADWPQDPFGDRPTHQEASVPRHPKDPLSGLTIQMAVHFEDVKMAYIYTKGLWEMGFPELSVRVPPDIAARVRVVPELVSIFLATGLTHLAGALIRADDLDIPPYQGELDGQPVQMWLGPAGRPEGPVALELGDEVHTVLPVECSLWQKSGRDSTD